ncbi:hypothetical protein BB561_004455 [Smittium simulii]|uniref:Endonuclease/exonuclease/phosphatase domain-containing protein n=1 Tax=Smittium simulii TaxID=133385 RepID=A0A2T9YG84_9FUNG|nr:hypothetical protein BB561_004455 [Smittium simulii]
MYSDTHSITVKFRNFVLNTVYFSPSMDISSIKKYLPTEDVTLMLGDINTHFGASFGVSKSGPFARIELFNEFSSLQKLNHIAPEPLGNTPDHLFVKDGINCTWRFYPEVPNDLSDHKFMTAELAIGYNVNNNNSSFEPIRYQITQLEDPKIKEKIVRLYEENCCVLNELWETVLKYSIKHISNSGNSAFA